jgi:hypothetical protein
MTTRIGMPAANHNPLGAYLKDRRTKLDPAAFGVSPSRRRTPGLRREEVAQRANISATWYTWLEQGRGGAPSADVLDRIARGCRRHRRSMRRGWSAEDVAVRVSFLAPSPSFWRASTTGVHSSALVKSRP